MYLAYFGGQAGQNALRNVVSWVDQTVIIIRSVISFNESWTVLKVKGGAFVVGDSRVS